ncbi:gluconate 2-dehydrogenase subunit 3 family protein [Halieaceae bacterium IMCC14734]|uniref:Gluconate 2-dehydrogenase subunit 3 family protein n=1 Tax=Candidatus Litorirhabdus singularis TaxID=2518993 RepID=A0ABT3TIP7_9GAMM|nr:gluconate 2-dehydrogenase subunit 3 family protein [Candidatus Litorirhabdus singularis]MCX2982211.1 gluconate 2-dehydrogenase subunit 3 family protein [Candidatus Litorirhabdus singularis]
MNRREFLQCAAVFAAGASSIPTSWALSNEQSRFLAGQTNYIDRKPLTYFNAAQRAAVTAAAEQVIPATDTPGATDAGVARFIELMVADWFNDAERAMFDAGLADLLARANGDFAALSGKQQLQLLEQLEAEAGDAQWYNLGNVTRVWDSEAPFICQFKELTVLGFMLSEVGGTQFLRENPMGSFNGSLALAEDDSAYAAELPMRMLSAETGL